MIMYLIYTVIAFWLFNGSFVSPSFVFSLSLSMMLCLAYYTATTMGMLFAIGIRTFNIFAFAGIVFIATEFCVYLLRTSSCSLKPLESHVKYEPLIVNRQIQICATIFFAMSAVIAIYVLYVNTGGGSWADRMRAYKKLVFTDPYSLRYIVITAQLYKINVIAIDVFGYIMVYNLTVCNVPVKQVLSYIIDTVLYAVFSAVYTGARQSAIEVLLFLMSIYAVLNMRPGGKAKIYRFILRAVPLLLVVAALFTVTGGLVGRYTTKSSLENLAEYICGGLYFFDRHIDDPSTKYFGQATLSYVYSIPQRMGMKIFESDDDILIMGEFDIYGNTVTVFGRWYRDFGTIGVFIMTCIISLLYSLVYHYKLTYLNNIDYEHHFARIFYCQFLTGLIWACYDDRIASLLTVQSVVFLIAVPIVFWLLIKKRLRLI